MIHPDTEIRFISAEIGYGVVATKLIPKGTITWALDALDRVFTPSQLSKMDTVYQEILNKYTYRNNQGDHVLCWDFGRYVNHSFNSNCISTAYNFEIAVRDILPGEELTDDYGYLNVNEPFEALAEPGSTRTMVYPDDLLKHHAVWDEKILQALPNILKHPQPLKHLLEKGAWEKMLNVINGKEQMDSILTCYYPG
jgi:SET domain-containing protein